MASHFDDIGFEIKDRDSFGRLIKGVIEKGKKKKTKSGIYHIYPRDNKLQIWVLTNKKTIHDITPFYEGESSLKIKVEEQDIKKGIATRIRCWVNPRNEDDDGDCPFVFDVPNYWLVNNKVKNGKIYHIKLTAFAEEAEVYKNDKDFSKNAPKNKEIRNSTKKNEDKDRRVRGYAPNHFIPMGLFSFSEKKENKASAMFAGTIKKVKLIENPITHKKFYWMLVETFFGELDVVCAEKELSNKPKVGKILDGMFYLTGKFNIREEESKSLLDKLFGR